MNSQQENFKEAADGHMLPLSFDPHSDCHQVPTPKAYGTSHLPFYTLRKTEAWHKEAQPIANCCRLGLILSPPDPQPDTLSRHSSRSLALLPKRFQDTFALSRASCVRLGHLGRLPSLCSSPICRLLSGHHPQALTHGLHPRPPLLKLPVSPRMNFPQILQQDSWARPDPALSRTPLLTVAPSVCLVQDP